MSSCQHNHRVMDYSTIWSAVTLIVSLHNLLASCGCFVFIYSIMSKENLRNNAFNLYVVFLLLPDALNTMVFALYGAFRAFRCGLIPAMMNEVFNANQFFYYFSNFYLNVVLAYELNVILERSSRRMRTGPPPMKRAITQIALVFTFASLYTIWGALDVSWSFWDGTNFGSPKGGIFTEMAALILTLSLMMIPLIYVATIRIRIWKKNLIPREGKTAMISVFFIRIVVVFFAFYFPSAILTIASTYMINPAYFWVEKVIFVFNASQAMVTIYMVSYKEDIWKAVQEGCWRYGCFCCLPSREEHTSERTSAAAGRSQTSRFDVSGRSQTSRLDFSGSVRLYASRPFERTAETKDRIEENDSPSSAGDCEPEDAGNGSISIPFGTGNPIERTAETDDRIEEKDSPNFADDCEPEDAGNGSISIPFGTGNPIERTPGTDDGIEKDHSPSSAGDCEPEDTGDASTRIPFGTSSTTPLEVE